MKTRDAVLLAALTIMLTACGSAPADQTPVSAPQAEPAKTAQPIPQPTAQPSATVRSQIEAIALQGGESKDRRLQVFEVSLSPVPSGFGRLVLVSGPDSQVSLVALDQALTKATLLASVPDVLINTAKVFVAAGEKGTVRVISQRPFSASEFEAVLAWDGSALTVVSTATDDPSAAYFARRQELLANGDVDGLMQVDGSPMYPASYGGYYAQPGPILKLAYDRALGRYRAGDVAGALRYTVYGIESYEQVYGDLLKPTNANLHAEAQLKLEERVAIVNDHAFFLAELGRNEQAEPLLLQVIAAAPDRTVAYLNLGDVQWALGKQPEARKHYRKYLDLLGANQQAAPPHVMDRMK